MQRFIGKSVIVTGGSSGIGRATAERFAREGANVLIFANRAEEVRATAESLRSQGYSVLDFHGDVSVASDVQRAVDLAVERFGGIDVLVSNAGYAPNEPFVEIREASWDRLMAVNLKGMFLFGQACAREMIKQNRTAERSGVGRNEAQTTERSGVGRSEAQTTERSGVGRSETQTAERSGVGRSEAQTRGGALLFTASVNGLAAETGLTSYNASKAAIILMVKTIALELGPHRIRANAVCPGFIDTPLTHEFIENDPNWHHYKRSIAWGRAGKPEEVAAAFAFLASDDAVYITGESLTIDGGQMAALTEPGLFDDERV